MAAAPTGILNSFAVMDGHGSGSILRNRNDIALRCDDESRSLTPLWPAVSKTGLTSLRVPRDRMKGNRLIVCLTSICRPPEATGGEMRHRFGTPLHYAFGNCPVAVRCCQTAARKRSASDMEMWGQVLHYHGASARLWLWRARFASPPLRPSLMSPAVAMREYAGEIGCQV